MQVREDLFSFRIVVVHAFTGSPLTSPSNSSGTSVFKLGGLPGNYVDYGLNWPITISNSISRFPNLVPASSMILEPYSIRAMTSTDHSWTKTSPFFQLQMHFQKRVQPDGTRWKCALNVIFISSSQIAVYQGTYADIISCSPRLDSRP